MNNAIYGPMWGSGADLYINGEKSKDSFSYSCLNNSYTRIGISAKESTEANEEIAGSRSFLINEYEVFAVKQLL